MVAVLFFAVMAGFVLVLSRLRFGCGDENESKVRTSNMGTLYELEYRVVLKDGGVPKEFLDELRCRNGNLNIVCGRLASWEAL